MLSAEQRQFITLFVLDGAYDLHRTCQSLGLRPSVVHAWFRDPAFQAEKRRAENAVLAAMGLGPLRTIREMMALAFSNIADVTLGEDGGLGDLPRHITAAIKSVENGCAIGPDGKATIYAKKIVMHDKAGPLKYIADTLAVGEAPEVKATQATDSNDGPKRITGLIVRPPLTKEDKELEDLLK